MIEHELKKYDDFFEPLDTEKKTFELRYNDRPYKIGDILKLVFVNRRTMKVTGKVLRFEVTYIFDPNCTPVIGLDEDFIIMAIKKLLD